MLDDERKEALGKQLRLNKMGELYIENEEWKEELKSVSSARECPKAGSMGQCEDKSSRS